MTTSPLDRLGLRERKKLKTRRAIQEHALRLFLSEGYDATTVEQIAAAAEVSPSTFFRYFPTKEDVVITDEYDPLIAESLRRQPAELSPVEALRRTLREIVGLMLVTDRQRILERVRLSMSVPALRARQWENTQETQRLIARMVAERLGRSPDEFELRAFSAALLGVWQVTIMTWVEDGGEGDVLALLEQALDYLSAGCPL
ncbi:TetR family transcriptional regulator [Actinomadura scrupuli]|uniref:acyl-CoA-like ligand-binding transcription factor n=1 Tax=Actinomadura scrupuli TaxID=559629 RepID=UPI003D95A04E